jgi:hypothetical protein
MFADDRSLSAWQEMLCIRTSDARLVGCRYVSAESIFLWS